MRFWEEFKRALIRVVFASVYLTALVFAIKQVSDQLFGVGTSGVSAGWAFLSAAIITAALVGASVWENNQE